MKMQRLCVTNLLAFERRGEEDCVSVSGAPRRRAIYPPTAIQTNWPNSFLSSDGEWLSLHSQAQRGMTSIAPWRQHSRLGRGDPVPTSRSVRPVRHAPCRSRSSATVCRQLFPLDDDWVQMYVKYALLVHDVRVERVRRRALGASAVPRQSLVFGASKLQRFDR